MPPLLAQLDVLPTHHMIGLVSEFPAHRERLSRAFANPRSSE